MIYYLQAELIGRIKIGFSSAGKLARRLSALQTASPVPLALLATAKGNRAREKALHERFRDYRVHGEWFFPGERLVRHIARLQGKAAPPPRPREGRCDRAVRFLLSAFGDRPEWFSDDLFRAAGAHGVSRNAVFDASRRLRLPRPKKVTAAGQTRWVWWVPEGWSAEGGV